MGTSESPFEAWNSSQVFYLNNLSLAYADVYQAQEFIKVLPKIKNENNRVK